MRNGNSRLLLSNFICIFTLVVQTMLSNDHASEVDLHKEPCTFVSR